jgi:UDP-N-acetylmuramoyl-L-alanyl-D-glutamate--2,6-diaminopimelate ligase
VLSSHAASAVQFVSQLLQQAGMPLASVRLQADSRALQRGDIFLAMPGANFDGRAHLSTVAEKGARAALWDPDQFEWPSGNALPHCAVPHLKHEMGYISAALLGDPSEQLHVFAFTGTSGKTTCTTWTAQLLASLGEPCAVIGTRGAGLPDELVAFGLTTPQAFDLQQWFAQFARQGILACAIEASSIGIKEGRLNGTRIKTALFTNLTQDHLDYHGDMIQYGRAKAELFSWPQLQQAVFNADDPASKQMGANIEPQTDVVIIGITQSGDQCPSNIEQLVGQTKSTNVKRLWASDIRFNGNQTRLTLQGDFGQAFTTLQVPGQFNISNALMVAACALLKGHAIEKVAAGLARLTPVEGRMQSIGGDNQVLVVVDYAHKPDALEQVLHSLRSQANARGGKLWCVFGCGGDRDRSKRPLMGAIAAKLADQVIVTSDNPRSEHPAAIADQVVSGMSDIEDQVVVELDRAKAIDSVLSRAAHNDVVLIAGKGHEDYQETNGVKAPFSDLVQAKLALAKSRACA